MKYIKGVIKTMKKRPDIKVTYNNGKEEKQYSVEEVQADTGEDEERPATPRPYSSSSGGYSSRS